MNIIKRLLDEWRDLDGPEKLIAGFVGSLVGAVLLLVVLFVGFNVYAVFFTSTNESAEEQALVEEAGVEDASILRYSFAFGQERYWRDHIYEMRKTRLELRGIKEELEKLNARLENQKTE